MSSIPCPSSIPEAPHDSHFASARRRWIAFGIVAAVLLTAGIGFNAVVAKMQVTFQKLPVNPAAPLLSISASAGPWVQTTIDRSLNPDFEHELGTKEYVFRSYVDTRKLDPDARKQFLAATIEDREKMLTSGVIRPGPDGMIKFMLTYYTGSVDTVPHVPERCYAADGFKPSTYEVVEWPILPRMVPADCITQVRLINFEDQIDSRASRQRQVSYFFHVNGEYAEDPLFEVRKKLQNLLEPHAYFAKIELVTDLPEAKGAAAIMSDFLTHLMPEIERVLPDWKKLKADPAA
ncbi:MAG TPA: hypothetical protein VGB55_01845 [Tepidisphaeraceae bacterium]|jgi:hypothetical protein